MTAHIPPMKIPFNENPMKTHDQNMNRAFRKTKKKENKENEVFLRRKQLKGYNILKKN